MGLEKMKEKTKQPDKVADSISKKRLKMKTSRSQNRSLILSKSRDLPSTVDEPDQPPAANPKVSMLVSMFETSPSPVKMPRPPQQALQCAEQTPVVCCLNVIFLHKHQTSPNLKQGQ